MKIGKTLIIVTLCLLMTGVFLSFLLSPVLALQKDTFILNNNAVYQQKETEKVNLSTKFPVLSGSASTEFSFDIELLYEGGKEAKYFDLKVNGPKEFFYSIQQSYGGTTDIASIKLDPTKTYPESIKVKAFPNIFAPPDPGEYTITLSASSGEVKNTVDLKCVITAKYSIKLETPEGILSTNITADKDNYFTINVKNDGTAPVENINLSSRIRGAPSNWNIKFEPERIDSLAVKATREVKVNIKPPAKTISGDYEIILTAKPESQNTQDEITIRVTVLTQTIWGWVGVGVVVIVVAGLIAMFVFLGRR